MNRLRCFLSGGHRYSPSKIVTTRNPSNKTIVLNNFCVKCGKLSSFEISEAFVDKEIEKLKLREMRRWVK